MKYLKNILAERKQNKQNSKYVKRIGWLFLLVLILILSSKLMINILYYSNSEVVIAEILHIQKINKARDAYGYLPVSRFQIKYQYTISDKTYIKYEEISNDRLNSLGYHDIDDNINVKIQCIKFKKGMSRITSKE
jgi:hypothetical protein